MKGSNESAGPSISGEDRSEHHPSGFEPAGSARRRRRSRWVVVGAVVAAISVLTSLLAFGLSRDPNLIGSALIGRPAPNFTLRTLDGSGTVRLSSFRGQVIVLNFWASWCADCRVEHPALADAWERYRDQGVVILGIPFEDPLPNSRAYAREVGGDWPLLTDPDSKASFSYGVYGVPETFFIGRDGRVAYKQVGAVTYELLTDQITRLLSAGTAAPGGTP